MSVQAERALLEGLKLSPLMRVEFFDPGESQFIGATSDPLLSSLARKGCLTPRWLWGNVYFMEKNK